MTMGEGTFINVIETSGEEAIGLRAIELLLLHRGRSKGLISFQATCA